MIRGMTMCGRAARYGDLYSREWAAMDYMIRTLASNLLEKIGPQLGI